MGSTSCLNKPRGLAVISAWRVWLTCFLERELRPLLAPKEFSTPSLRNHIIGVAAALVGFPRKGSGRN